MAWTILPKPGSETGPCEKACEHTDCAQTRAWAEALCPKCGEAIGYERPMMLVALYPPIELTGPILPKPLVPWHFVCRVEHVEAGGE